MNNLKIKLCFLFIISLYHSSFGQINGRIVSEHSLLSLPGATITTTSAYAITDTSGYFSIDCISGSKLCISHIGYLTDTITVTDTRKFYLIHLKPSLAYIDAIVIQSAIFQYNLRESPGSMHIIKGNEFRYESPYTMIEKMNHIPGIHVQSGTQNTNRLTIRGIGSRTPYSTNRIKLYYNDIPLTNTDGISAIEDIDLSMISTMEIIKGPKSAVYGAGLGGTLLTYSKYDRSNYLSYSYSDYKSNTLALKLSRRSKNNSIQFYANRFSSEGYRDNNSINKINSGFSYKYDGNKLKVEVSLLAIFNNSGIPSSLNDTTYQKHPQMAAPSWQSIGSLEKYNKIISGVKTDYYLTRKLRNTLTLYSLMSKQDEIRPYNILGERVVTTGMKEVLKVRLNRFQFQGGFDTRLEFLNWATYEVFSQGNSDDRINDFTSRRLQTDLFLLAGFKSAKLTIETGLSSNLTNYSLYDRMKGKIDNSGEQYFPQIISPFFGINYHPFRDIFIYSSFGHGFSHPSLQETLLPDGEINKNLRPEEGYQADMGVRILKLDNKLFFDIGVYQIFLNNMLVTKRAEDESFYSINAGKTTHKGIESAMNLKLLYWSLIEKNLIHFSTSYSASINKFISFSDGFVSFNGKSLPGIPSYSFSSSLQINLPYGFHVKGTALLIGSQYLTDFNDKSVNEYRVSNLRMGYVSKQFSKLKQTVELYVTINNVLNEKYASMVLVNAPSQSGERPRYYYPGLPRNYMAGLVLHF